MPLRFGKIRLYIAPTHFTHVSSANIVSHPKVIRLMPAMGSDKAGFQIGEMSDNSDVDMSLVERIKTFLANKKIPFRFEDTSIDDELACC